MTTTKTVEEILGAGMFSDQISSGILCVSYKQALEAMTEYASQFKAPDERIEFHLREYSKILNGVLSGDSTLNKALIDTQTALMESYIKNKLPALSNGSEDWRGALEKKEDKDGWNYTPPT